MKTKKLQLDDYTFEVDLNNRVERRKVNPEMASVGATLVLPSKTKYGYKKVPPKGEFSYEIILIGKPERGSQLSKDCFDDNASPISFMINNCDVGRKGTFTVDGCETNLKLFFDASTIKDCGKTLTEDRMFDLPFRLVIRDEDGKSEFTFEDSLKVKIKKFVPVPVFTFIDKTDKLKYHIVDEKPIVGQLEVSHNADFSCAPDLVDQKFELGCIVAPGSPDKGKRPHEPLKSTDRKDILQLRKDGNESSMQTINKLCAGESVVFDVLLDMNAVNNPRKEDNLDKYCLTIDGKEIGGGFELYRNDVLTKRKTIITMPSSKYGTISHDITECSGCDLGELFISTQPRMEYTLTLTFSNDAEATDRKHPFAAVLVWGVKIADLEGETDRIQLSKGKTIKDVICLQSKSHQWALSPKQDKSCDYLITINSDDILDIIPSKDENETFVDITIKLEYNTCEDSKGDYKFKFDNVNGKNNLHKCNLKLRLKKQPQREWLCVDFGTSAVVATFAKDSSNEQNSLIDLKKQKGYLLDKVYGVNDGRNSIEDEDEKLISSTICFNVNNSIDYRSPDFNMEDFLGLAVWFSPSVRDINKDYLLPCLKTIIGYEYLPQIFTDGAMMGFRYKCDDEEIQLERKAELMKVSVVSSLIYRQLFRFYLSQRLNKNRTELIPRKVNKLVLSVPNTYTPLDIQTVKRLARESMPNIHPEYLHTISESDAVACYYVSHKNKFLSSIEDKNKMQQLTAKENVLVYDMGAGTLDLTWFVRKTTKDAQQRDLVDVEIKGKMGVNKAGNYIDYELATILLDLWRKKTKGPKNNNDLFNKALQLDSSIAKDVMFDSGLRTDLKNYVKDLKKLLGDETAEVPELIIDRMTYFRDHSTESSSQSQQGVQLKMSDILNHKHFQEIIDEMTENVLINFGKRYGDKTGKIDIDVLIFSGRSTSLNAIREGVKKHIGKICNKPEDLLYADLGTCELSNKIEQPTGASNNILKTVVAQGALAYAALFARKESNYRLHNQKYYASYGLVEYLGNEEYNFVPLIGMEANGMIEKDGKIYSDEYTIDTHRVSQVDLIQSYSSDVVNDYIKGNFDTISKLSNISCDGLDNPKFQLVMTTQHEGGSGTTLEYSFAQGSERLNPHDDFNNLSLRKSLWPVIFDNNELE